VLQDLPASDKKRQAEVLMKLQTKKVNPVTSDDPITKIAAEVLHLNQIGMAGMKQEIESKMASGFCQDIQFCPPKNFLTCFVIVIGGIETCCIPNCCICYNQVCTQQIDTRRKFTYAEVAAEPLPKLYLVDVAELEKLQDESMPSFETLKERDLVSVLNFDRCAG
jgi:hypothetical protein